MRDRKGLSLPSAKQLQQGNVFTPVCHSVHRGCITACTGADTRLLGRHIPEYTGPPPPWADISQHALGQTAPPARHHLGQTATAADGTHPTGMHSCFHLNLTCDLSSIIFRDNNDLLFIFSGECDLVGMKKK